MPLIVSIAHLVPESVKSSSVSSEVELHFLPVKSLLQPASTSSNGLFAVSVADQMAVAADALGVPVPNAQAPLPPAFLARTRTR